jgi:hypothetical protein
MADAAVRALCMKGILIGQPGIDAVQYYSADTPASRVKLWARVSAMNSLI